MSDFDFGSKALDEKIQKILSLQSKLVDLVCREMFYDVATVLRGRSVELWLRPWAFMYNDVLGNDDDSMVKIKWQNLLDTSLVKIDSENGVVQIHDALRHLGRVQCKSEGKRVWVEAGKLQGLKRLNEVGVYVIHLHRNRGLFKNSL